MEAEGAGRGPRGPGGGRGGQAVAEGAEQWLRGPHAPLCPRSSSLSTRRLETEEARRPAQARWGPDDGGLPTECLVSFTTEWAT